MSQFKLCVCKVVLLCLISVLSNASDCTNLVDRWANEFKEQSQLPKEVSLFYQEMEDKSYDIYIAGIALQKKISINNRKQLDLAMNAYISFLNQSVDQVNALQSWDESVKQKLEKSAQELNEYLGGASSEDKLSPQARKSCVFEKGIEMLYVSEELIQIVNYYGLYGLRNKDSSVDSFYDSILYRKNIKEEDIENLLFMSAF